MELKQVFQSIAGGWRTWGPFGGTTPGGYDSGASSIYDSVTQESAMALSAVHACITLRAETLGTLPLHIRDKSKKVIEDHDLHELLRVSPNSMMTGPEFLSMMDASVDMEGNGLAIISRRSSGTPTNLMPVDIAATGACIKFDEKRGRYYYDIGGEPYDADDVLHFKGFATTKNGLWGLSRLEVGRRILAAQITANDTAMRMFKQSVKVGGFLVPKDRMKLEDVQALKDRLDDHSRPENAGKMLITLHGMQPISGKEFRISSVDAELLNSRLFGIEEVCRLFNTPPQLIGHSNKASSWASSIENINLHYLTYSCVPTCVRKEARIVKQLMSRADRAKGLEAKFNLGGLMRADLKTQQEFYASGLQNGYLNQNEVRDLLDRGNIPDGDVYRVQMNMAGAGENGKDGGKQNGK